MDTKELAHLGVRVTVAERLTWRMVALREGISLQELVARAVREHVERIEREGAQRAR